MSVAQNFGKLFNRTPAQSEPDALSDVQVGDGIALGDPLREPYQGEGLNSVQGDPGSSDADRKSVV